MASTSASASSVLRQNDDADIMPAFNAWRNMLSSFTGLGVADEQKQSETKTQERLQQTKDCRRCEQWRDEVIQESPIVRFMLGHVNSLPKPNYAVPDLEAESTEANSPVPIYCTPCGPNRSGGFAPDVGIVLCQDNIFSKRHVEDTLAHELIHEWDHRRFDIDWKDMRHLACSEIRAASLSGDCRWGRELRRRHFNFTKQHQRRAVLSLLQQKPLASSQTMSQDEKEAEANRLVNEVWSSCWKDTRPFDEIY